MKIISNYKTIDLSDRIRFYEKEFVRQPVVKLITGECLEHLAAYLAWRNNGGNVAVISPLLPPEQRQYIDSKIAELNVENSIIFNTSGTTGLPKLVIHNEQQVQQAIKAATNAQNWSSKTKWLNQLPAFTLGFWNTSMMPAVHHDCEITIDTNIDSDHGCNATLLSPGIVDQFRVKKLHCNFARFDEVAVGSSQVLKRHSEFFFEQGGREFNHVYGMNEICEPILSYKTTSVEQPSHYLNLTPICDNDYRIVGEELYVRGKSVCENFKEFKHDGDWLATGDLWHTHGDLYEFKGRNNDIVSINSYQCSLLLIENVTEERTDLGECVAVVRNRLGSDWIEVFYTNAQADVNHTKLKQIYGTVLPEYAIPRKYTYINNIPRSSLGKKTREVDNV
jgi:acyl-coenzyme A synthetase/AMP-(fatty) acid ligase